LSFRPAEYGSLSTIEWGALISHPLVVSLLQKHKNHWDGEGQRDLALRLQGAASDLGRILPQEMMRVDGSLGGWQYFAFGLMQVDDNVARETCKSGERDLGREWPEAWMSWIFTLSHLNAIQGSPGPSPQFGPGCCIREVTKELYAEALAGPVIDGL
jgi:hypothetical protein